MEARFNPHWRTGRLCQSCGAHASNKEAFFTGRLLDAGRGSKPLMPRSASPGLEQGVHAPPLFGTPAPIGLAKRFDRK